ncbi:MAG: AAA family ATPase [Polyangiales bacterium]
MMTVEGAPMRGPLSGSEVVAKHDAMARGEKARLAWLHVHALDDIQEQRLQFDREINVILGKNGVGKTTLLNLLSNVLRWDFSAWNQRSFDVEYQFELGKWFWHVRVKNVRDRELDREGGAGYRAEVSLHARYEEFELRCESDRSGYRRVINGAERRFESVGLWPLFLFSAHMDDAWSNSVGVVRAPLAISPDTTRFDEGLDVFRSMLGWITAERPLEWRSDGPAAWRGNRALEGELWRWLLPEKLLAQPDAPVLVKHEQLGISQAFLEALDAVDVVANFGLPEVQHQGDTTTVSVSSFELRMVRANGDVLRHTSWSWGQQRLVAFALYLAMNKHFVVADELVNGMHHDWIALCRRELEHRQSFVTSQNPIFVDYVDLDSIEQIQRSFILCGVKETSSGRTARTWRNMSEREATELWDARSSNFESTSETMRTRGWW